MGFKKLLSHIDQPPSPYDLHDTDTLANVLESTAYCLEHSLVVGPKGHFPGPARLLHTFGG